MTFSFNTAVMMVCVYGVRDLQKLASEFIWAKFLMQNINETGPRLSKLNWFKSQMQFKTLTSIMAYILYMTDLKGT